MGFYMRSYEVNAIDISIVVVCFIAVILIGIWKGKDESNSKEDFLGAGEQIATKLRQAL